MAITRWEPFSGLGRWEPLWLEPVREIQRLQQQMNRLFEEFMPSGDGGGGTLAFVPSAELQETGDTIYLKLEIPGLEAKDLDIEVTDESVFISGERKSETKTEEKGIYRSEFRYGRFERRIPLPAHVQSDKARAEYKNGMLTITLPKVEGEKRNVVKVNVS